MKKRITLKQIAKELNYSISTVSKALKNSPEIGIDAKTKIQAYAKLYNYKPNNVALSLKNRKTKTIGVIIPEMVHYFFAKVIIGIEKFAKKNSYNVIISLSNESFEKEVINIETLVDGQIDGLIISLSKETLLKQDFHHIHETIDLDIPVIGIDTIKLAHKYNYFGIGFSQTGVLIINEPEIRSFCESKNFYLYCIGNKV